MKWTDNPYRHVADDSEDLAYTPDGGRGKMVVLGILLPLVLLYFGTDAWLSEQATWPGSRGASMETTGATAKSIGVAYGFVGLFCHSRWFWGLLPSWRIFRLGTILSLIGMLSAGACAFYFLWSS